MEKSIALLADKLTVTFSAVLDRYPCNEDIECNYATTNYKVQDGDRIAIFKMGWKSLKNYILFEWAMDCSPAALHTVIFSSYDLPSDLQRDDLFQFCYISGENVVQGISTPFQIYSAASKSTVNLTDSLKNENQCTHLKHLLSLKDKEILRLKEENAVLKESLKAMVNERKFQGTKNYDGDIDELKDLTKRLNDALMVQQKEIDFLKVEFRKEKAEHKNLLLEKILAEKKFQAISSQKEAAGVKRLTNLDFDFDSLLPLPAFPFESPQ